MAWERGQKTRVSHVWMTQDDILELSGVLPEMQWFIDGAGQGEYFFFDSIAEALGNCTGKWARQACASLPLGLLVFNYSPIYPIEVIPERDFGSSTDISVYPDGFFSVTDSSISIRWNTTGQSEEVCVATDSLVKQIWKSLHKVTKPVKCHYLISHVDASSPRYRVGNRMYELVKQNGWCIQQGQFFLVE